MRWYALGPGDLLRHPRSSRCARRSCSARSTCTWCLVVAADLLLLVSRGSRFGGVRHRPGHGDQADPRHLHRLPAGDQAVAGGDRGQRHRRRGHARRPPPSPRTPPGCSGPTRCGTPTGSARWRSSPTSRSTARSPASTPADPSTVLWLAGRGRHPRGLGGAGAPGRGGRRRDDRLRAHRHRRLPGQPDHLGAPPGLGRPGAAAAARQRAVATPTATPARRLLALDDRLVRPAVQPLVWSFHERWGNPIGWLFSNAYVWISLALLCALPVAVAGSPIRAIAGRAPGRPGRRAGRGELDRDGRCRQPARGSLPAPCSRPRAPDDRRSPPPRPGGSPSPPRASPTRARPVPVNVRHLRRVLGRTGLLQIDSVNVLQRAHYLPMFSRLGPYPTAAARPGRATGRPGSCSSTGATRRRSSRSALQPLPAVADGGGPRARLGPDADRRHRAARAGRLGAGRRCATAARSRRPRSSRTCPRRTDHWGWNWSDAKTALEWLFWSGEVTTAGRNGSFARVYDLTERVLPAAVLAAPTPSRADAVRELVRRRPPRRSGSRPRSSCATTSGCRWTGSAPRSPSWSRRGCCGRCAVPGWKPRAYLHHDAKIPRRVRGEHAGQPVRPADLGAVAHRAAVRLPLPHRHLHPARPADARLLRAAVPARRRAGRPGGPQGRPPGRRAAGAGRLGCEPGQSAPARWPRRWPTALRRAGRAGWGSTRSRRRRRATWPPRWPAPSAGAFRRYRMSVTPRRSSSPDPAERAAAEHAHPGPQYVVAGTQPAVARFVLRLVRALAPLGRARRDRRVLRRCRVVRLDQQPDRRRRRRTRRPASSS